MYGLFFSINTRNTIKVLDAGALKVMQAVPEKHIISFFGLTVIYYRNRYELIIKYYKY